MGSEQRTERRGVGERLLAVLVSIGFVVAPVSGWAQEPAGDSNSSPGDSSASGDESKPSGKESTESGSDPESQESSGTEEGKSSEQASAGPTPTLEMLPSQSVQGNITELVPQRIGAMLRERLGSDERVELLPPFADVHKRREEGSTASAEIAEARKQYTSGIGLANAGKFDEAAEKLSKAVETLKENMADLQEFDVYADALLKLAWSHWEINHNYDARKEIREYAHLRPEATLDPKKYPDKFREIYATEVKKIEKAGTGTLVVEADAEGATVLIDGEQKGKTPAEVTDVGFGYHYLVVRGSQGGTWTQQLRVRGRGKKQTYEVQVGEGASPKKASGGAEEQAEQPKKAAAESPKGADSAEQKSKESDLPAFYTELQSSIADGEFGTELQPYLEELSSRTGAGFVAWVVMIREEGDYVAAPFVYRVEDGMFVQGDNVRFNVELSNLRVGVRDLEVSIIEIIQKMPEKQAVTSVSLGEKDEEKEKTASAAAVQQSESSGSSSGSGSSADPSVEPPPSPVPPEEDDSNDTWKYLGIGGAAVLVGGLVAGGVYYFGDQGQSRNKPKGFTATVTW